MSDGDMSTSESSEFETSHAGIRHECLSLLKIDELRVLCSNRNINHEVPTNKKQLIESIFKSKVIPPKNAGFSKEDLSIEIRARGLEHPNSANKNTLGRLLAKNLKTKVTLDALTNLKVAELQTLCHYRDIDIVSTKDRYIRFLTKANAPEPEISENMTARQLSAEMRARGLSTTNLNKKQMVEVLDSALIWEEQKLESHLNDKNVNEVMEGMEKAIDKLMEYIKGNKREIQENIKQNIKEQKGAAGGSTEWTKIEGTLRDARDEIIEMKSMVEVYSGYIVDSLHGTEEKEYENVVPYDNDSDIDEDYGMKEVVYVVYEDDHSLIMRQKEKAILGVFDSETAAEEFKDKLLDENEEMMIAIQEVVVYDEHDAE